MNNDQFEGKWGQIKGSIREHLGRLSNDDIEEVRGKRDRLLSKIRERYGDSREAAEEKLKELERKF